MSANDVDGPSTGEVGEPNPEAIAWYVEEAQRLLEDQQRRAESLRTRGGQVAGFGAAVLALIGGNTISVLEALDGEVRVVVGGALGAAALCLAMAVAVAVWGALRPKVFAAISSEEVAVYTGERFLTEPNLWRVHIRVLHTLSKATIITQRAGDSAERAIEWSLRAFLAGLAFSLLAIATLLMELI